MTPKNEQGKNILFLNFLTNNLKRLEHEAVEGNIHILRARLDAFGAWRNGHCCQGEYSNCIELPNVSDPEKAKAVLEKRLFLNKTCVDYAHT